MKDKWTGRRDVKQTRLGNGDIAGQKSRRVNVKIKALVFPKKNGGRSRAAALDPQSCGSTKGDQPEGVVG